MTPIRSQHLDLGGSVLEALGSRESPAVPELPRASRRHGRSVMTDPFGRLRPVETLAEARVPALLLEEIDGNDAPAISATVLVKESALETQTEAAPVELNRLFEVVNVDVQSI